MKKRLSILSAIAVVIAAMLCCAAIFCEPSFFVKANAAEQTEFGFAALKAKDGDAPAVIDIENRLVYGIPCFTSELSTFLSSGEGYSVDFNNSGIYAGTGSSVVISKNGAELAEFKTVTDGDINGDGTVDVLDAVWAEIFASGNADFSSIGKECLAAAKVAAAGETPDVNDFSAIVNSALSGTPLEVDRTLPENTANASIDDMVYSGTPLTPDFAVTCGGRVLEEGTDYTVAYYRNEDCGEAQAVITAAQNSLYAGTKTFTFEIVGSVDIKLPNVDKYLYRVGNANTVELSSLFETSGTVSSAETGVTVANIAGNAAGVYTANATAWEKGTLKFSGTGVVKVTVNGSLTLYLEVMNAKNSTTAQSAASSDIVLLNDVSSSKKLEVSGNHTLYGNGFKIIDTRTDTSSAIGFITFKKARVDNVEIVGQEYPEAVLSGTENQYYSPCVYITADTEIYNSHISGCSYAVKIDGGKVLIKNSLLEGGTVANITLNGGSLTLNDCVTSKSLSGGLNGLGVMVANKAAKLNIEGSFKQYNWLTSSEIPSTYTNIMKSMFDDSTYAFSNGGKKYVNMGVLMFNANDSIAKADAKNIVSDSSGNTYDFVDKTYLGVTGTCYTQYSSGVTASDLEPCVYESSGQYYTNPLSSFDYTGKNYIEKTADSNKYCYYDSLLDTVNISYDSEDGSFSWDPMILAVSKYGSALDYTVSMNGVDYTGKSIAFTESGDYEVVYSFTDENDYSVTDGALNRNTTVNEKTLKISVTAVDPADLAYHPAFSYADGNASKKIVANNNTYIMPDVSATSDSVGSTTVGGQTVYYPIVSVIATGSDGTTAYSSGKGYYFTPVFSVVGIEDYNQDTGAKQYTYDKSSQTWPHAQGATDGPNTEIFGFDSGAAYGNQPYGRSLNAQDYGFKYNKTKGLCYTTNGIEKDNSASSHLVRYHYVGNDGTTYYFYIKYNYGAMTYSGCFASGTRITLADGTQKPVEDITFDDKLLVWDFFTGTYTEKSAALLVSHGEDDYKVINTVYSDGTELRLIGTHGLFDYDLNEFIYITAENCFDYIGHTFVKCRADGSYETVTMTDAFITEEHTGAYSITSAETFDAFAEGLLTICPPEEFYNWMPTGDTLRYDTDAFNADVEKYGLYGYDVFKDYVTYEQYIAFNGAFLKIPVEKGIMTFEHLIELIEQCPNWMFKS